MSTPVAVIGSPSSTTRVVLNVLRSAYREPIYGNMLAFTLKVAADGVLGEREELAIGTVTAVETVNPFHTATALQAQHVADRGRLADSGDSGDTRLVTVNVEAVFRRDPTADQFDKAAREWLPSGTTLSTSPATGEPVTVVDQALVDDLMKGVQDQRWIGTMRGTGVRLPYTARDFSGPRGAFHDAIVGATGSGKTTCASWLLGADLNYDTLGQIIFDPQGQFASEYGVPFSLQGLAAACGRTVTVARLSRSLRLRKDAPMMLELLARTGWFTELAFGAGAGDQVTNAYRVMESSLDDKKALTEATGVDDWTQAQPSELMAYLLTDLREALPSGVIYAGKEGQNRVRYAIAKPSREELEDDGGNPEMVDRHRDGILDQRATGGKRWQAAFSRFVTVHNLWSPYTPDAARAIDTGTLDPEHVDPSQRRTRAWSLVSGVFAPKPGQPAPWLILDLSVDANLPGLTDDAAAEAAKVLDDPGVKARIMRQLVGDLDRAGTAAFNTGQALNVRVTFDEAWQYAMTPDPTTDKAVADLSAALEDGCRVFRKIGVGLRFILQAPSGLREGIWKQCANRVIGYGVTEQSDLRRLANIVGDDHLRLYAGQAGPEATGRYTFMFTGGGATGLSFGARPVFLDVFNTPDQWLAANEHWLTQVRSRWAHRLPAGDSGGPLTTIPDRPAQGGLVEAHLSAKATRSGAANANAAAALVGAAAGKGKATFGMPANPWAGVRDDSNPPPF